MRLLSSRLAWDAFGNLYNRRILILLKDVYRDIVEEVDPPGNARILDVGCGPGLLTVMLAQRLEDATLTGIDFSSTEIRAAMRSAARQGVENCRFSRADAMDLPFEKESFDRVVSTFSVKHWPDRKLGMSEICRVLVPGGGAIVTEYHRDCTEAEFQRFYKLVEAVLGRYLSALPTTPPAIRWTVNQGLSLDEAVAVSRDAGFAEISAKKIEGWPYLKLVLKK